MANEYGLITDRSPDHVARLKKLRSIGWYNMTDTQKAEYTGYATKDAYNYSDLNRVETAVAGLAERLGLTLTTKTNWSLWDTPTQSQMERYLSNVKTLVNKYAETHDISTFPPLPDSMNHLTWEGANNIEICLTEMLRGD